MALQSNTKSNSKENWAAKIRKVNTHLARWVFAKMSPAQTLRSKKSVNPSVTKWSCQHHNPTPWPAASSSFSIRSSSVCNGIAFSFKRLKRKLNKLQMIAICVWFCAPIHVPSLVVRSKIEMLRTDIILQDESDAARVSFRPYECMLHAWSCLLGNQLVAEAGLRVQALQITECINIQQDTFNGWTNTSALQIMTLWHFSVRLPRFANVRFSCRMEPLV